MISASWFVDRSTVHSMFDWPLHSQTSPIKTSLISSVFVPSTRSVNGSVLARMAGSVTRHVPVLSPVVVASLPSSVTRTFSSGAHQPHSGISLSCCRTMWSPKKPGSLTAAWQSVCVQRLTASVTGKRVRANVRFIVFGSLKLSAESVFRDNRLFTIRYFFERLDFLLSVRANRL